MPPPISPQPRRGRFSASVRQCPPTLRECPATGHDFGSSVRECPHVSVNTPHTLRTSSTSFTGGVGPLRPAGKRLARLSVVVAV